MKSVALAIMLLSQQTPSLNGVVTGQIQSRTGAPASGVRVVAMTASNAAALDASFSVFESITETDASGRFRLEQIPPGRYIVAAGLVDSPTFYPGVKGSADARAITVTAGGTVTGIDFALAQSAGVRVAGRVTGLPRGMPSGIVRAALLPGAGARGAAQMPESLVQADGSFEFLKIPPGTYNLRLIPSSTPITPTPVEVRDEDIGTLAVNIGPAILGRVEVEGGGVLPTPMNAPPGLPIIPALVNLQARRTDAAGTAPAAQIRADGVFLWLPAVGEYKVGVSMLPFGLSVKSMSFGSANLLETALKVTEWSSPPPDIRVLLTTTPLPGEPAGIKVSGQVFGLAGGPTSGEYWVRLMSSTASQNLAQNIVQQRVGDARVRDDGSFEMLRVPPGTYTTQVFPRGGPPIGGNTAVVVGDQEVKDVQLVATGTPRNPLTPGQPLSAPPPIPLGPATAGTLPSTEPRGVKVSGRVVVSPGGSTVPQTLVLFGPQLGGLTVQAAIANDGTFEFKNVPPGIYDARTLPLAVPPTSSRVVVELQDLTGIQIAAPAQSEIRGQVTLQGGRSMPDLSGAIVRLQSTDGTIDVPVAADGRFAMKITQGEYRVSVNRIPSGYVVRSLVGGTTNLLNAPLKFGATTEIRIILGVTP